MRRQTEPMDATDVEENRSEDMGLSPLFSLAMVFENPQELGNKFFE